MSLLTLPPEVSIFILIELTDQDIYNLCLTCMEDHALVYFNDIFWRAKAMKTFFLDINIDALSGHVLFQYRYIKVHTTIREFVESMGKGDHPMLTTVWSLIELFSQCDLSTFLSKDTKLLTLWYKFIVGNVILKHNCFESKIITLIPIPFEIIQKYSKLDPLICYLFNRPLNIGPIDLDDAIQFMDQVICTDLTQFIDIIVLLVAMHLKINNGFDNIGPPLVDFPIIKFCIKKLLICSYHDKITSDHVLQQIENVGGTGSGMGTVTVSYLMYVFKQSHNILLIEEILKHYVEQSRLGDPSLSIILRELEFDLDINILASLDYVGFINIGLFRSCLGVYVDKFPNSITPENLATLRNL